MLGIIFLPSVFAVYDFEITERKARVYIYKAEFRMKYAGSGYNICPIVTVFIYIFEQNQSQEEGISLCVSVCLHASKKKCFIKL